MVSRLSLILCIALSAAALVMSFSAAPVLRGARVGDVAAAHPLEAAELLLDRVAYARARAWAALEAGRAAEAENWSAKALAAAPRDAYAALALAWSLAGQGREAEARAALEVTYALAPRSMVLARSRVALAQGWWPRLDDFERARLLEEIRIARGVDAAGFNEMAARAPRLAALHRLAMRETEGGTSLEEPPEAPAKLKRSLSADP